VEVHAEERKMLKGTFSARYKHNHLTRKCCLTYLLIFLTYVGISLFFFRGLIFSEGVVLRCDWPIPPNINQI